MRLVQFPVPTGKREAVLGFLADAEFDYTLVEEVSGRGYEAMLFVPLETGDIDQLMDGLRDIGIQEQGFVAVGGLETLVSHRYEGSDEATGVARESDEDARIGHEELLSRAEEMTAAGPNYVALIALSAVVATAGLLTDSAAVIVGSMVIAPLLGPAIGASVGRMIHEPSLFREGIVPKFSESSSRSSAPSSSRSSSGTPSARAYRSRFSKRSSSGRTPVRCRSSSPSPRGSRARWRSRRARAPCWSES